MEREVGMEIGGRRIVNRGQSLLPRGEKERVMFEKLGGGKVV